MIFAFIVGSVFGGIVGYLVALPEGENTCVCRDCRLERVLSEFPEKSLRGDGWGQPWRP